MFRPFPNWPSSGWLQCQRNYIPTINRVISVSVSTEKGGEGGRDLVYKKQGVCADWRWKLNTCINRVGIVCPLLVICVGSRGKWWEAPNHFRSLYRYFQSQGQRGVHRGRMSKQTMAGLLPICIRLNSLSVAVCAFIDASAKHYTRRTPNALRHYAVTD